MNISSLVDYLDINAESSPNELALSFDESSWTWLELNEQVTVCAHLLLSKGVLPKHHVALWLQNTPAFIISFLAILKCNAIAAPLNPA
jgi:acyl-CoA synthetase (AMP-forming)/AMP-acid ligase II